MDPIDNVVEIDFWTVQLYRGGLRVEGHKLDEASEIFWHSSLIVKRLSNFLVKSCTGSVYRLVGPMDEEAMMENECAQFLVERFKNGIPPNWVTYVVEGTKHIKEIKSKDSENHVVREPEKKVLSIQPTNAPKQKGKGNSSVKAKPKVKSSLCKPVKLSHNNTLLSISGVEEAGTIDDPLVIDKLPKTRSGRVVIPRLSYWTGQRALIRPHSQTVDIIPGTPSSIEDSQVLVFKRNDVLERNEHRAMMKLLTEKRFKKSKKPSTSSRDLPCTESETAPDSEDKDQTEPESLNVQSNSVWTHSTSVFRNTRSKSKGPDASVSLLDCSPMNAIVTDSPSDASECKDSSAYGEVCLSSGRSRNRKRSPEKTNSHFPSGNVNAVADNSFSKLNEKRPCPQLRRARRIQDGSLELLPPIQDKYDIMNAAVDEIDEMPSKSHRKRGLKSLHESLRLHDNLKSDTKHRRRHSNTSDLASNACSGEEKAVYKFAAASDASSVDVGLKRKGRHTNRKQSPEKNKTRLPSGNANAVVNNSSLSKVNEKSLSQLLCRPRSSPVESIKSLSPGRNNIEIMPAAVDGTNEIKSNLRRKRDLKSSREYSSSDDVDVTSKPKKRGRHSNPGDATNSAWSEKEIARYTLACRVISHSEPEYWSKVANHVGTKTEEQCKDFHFKDASDVYLKKVSRSSKQHETITEPTQLTGRVGTLKRKRQLRELIENHTSTNKDDDNDVYSSTPYRGLKTVKVPTLQSLSHRRSLSSLKTPSTTDAKCSKKMTRRSAQGDCFQTPCSRPNYPNPVSEKKTPFAAMPSPGFNDTYDRGDIDGYVYRFQKKSRKQWGVLANRKTQVIPDEVPAKNPIDDVDRNLFIAPTLAEHEDSENADYYFSDSE